MTLLDECRVSWSSLRTRPAISHTVTEERAECTSFQASIFRRASRLALSEARKVRQPACACLRSRPFRPFRPSAVSPFRPSALSPFRPFPLASAPMPSRTPLLDDRAFGRTLVRMASEIVERSRGTEELVLVGIQRRGVELADRLKRLIDASEGSNFPCGKLDITLYRDDLQTVGPRPVVGETGFPISTAGPSSSSTTCSTPGAPSGRRSTSVADFGRPRAFLLCVLIDRGGARAADPGRHRGHQRQHGARGPGGCVRRRARWPGRGRAGGGAK